MSIVIDIRDLTVSYGDHVVLTGVTAQVMQQEICTVLGTSGCGKTTLLKSVIGLVKPAAGTVSLFGAPAGDIDDDATALLLRKVGVLFQNGALLGSLTVADNVRLPLQMHTELPGSVIDEMAMQKLSQVGLAHAATLYPRELSGGMRKRAALARALALDPPLLFCDEPSAGLDPVTSAGLDDLLLELRERLSITIVVVTHELFSIEKIADRIIFLYQGRLLYSGPPAPARAQTSGPMADFFARREAAGPSGAGAGVPFIAGRVR